MAKKSSGKPAFGGYQVDFAGQTDTMEAVFGTTPLSPGEMTKRLWEVVKQRGLERRPAK